MDWYLEAHQLALRDIMVCRSQPLVKHCIHYITALPLSSFLTLGKKFNFSESHL